MSDYPMLISNKLHSFRNFEGQTWVSWHLESEKDDPGINDPEISELFDLLISDPQDSKIARGNNIHC